MARSALFDQLDGGFARYSVTRDWSVPHFEKMLYDNAQLLREYVHWVRLGGNQVFAADEAAEVAVRTAEWLLESLGLGSLGESGGAGFALASSLDADSLVDGEHHEGASYLWTVAGLQEVLGDAEGAAVARLMNVAPEGTVSAYGSPLHPARRLDRAAADSWARARPALLTARNLRPQPARDEKVVAGWNGLAVAALAEAGVVLGRPDFLAAAESIAAYLEGVHWQAEARALIRVSHAGTARGREGLLEDYAFCAEGMFALYSATGRTYCYRFAEQLVQTASSRFVVAGRLVDTAGGDGQVRAAQGGQAGLDPFDNATPSGAAAFAGALLSYAALSGSAEHRALAAQMLALLPPLAGRAPRVAGWLLATAQAALAGPVEAAIVGPASPERTELHLELLKSASPGLVIAVEDDGGAEVPPSDAPSEGEPVAAGGEFVPAGGERVPAGGEPVPLLAGRPAGPGGSPLAYLCRNMVCERPVATPEDLRARLDLMVGAGPVS